jgi:5-formyltetrahydrofolate cyclo-ligase
MIPSQKKRLRTEMKEKRALFFQQHPDAGDRLATLFFENIDLTTHGVVGAYWPIGTELDVRPLIKKLMERGVECALPRITPQGLEFHIWTESRPLVKGSFHVFEPHPNATVIPDVLLVPLLAFEGHFDRYLHQHPMLTIGIGFTGQEVEEIPTQSHDFALDYILTEEGLIS